MGTTVEVTNLLRSSTETGDGILVTATYDVTKGETKECPYQCQGDDADGGKCCTSAGITNSKCSLNGPSDTCQCENTFPKYRNTPCYIEMRCHIDQMWQHHVGWLGGGCKIEPGATCKLGGINQCSTGYHCAFGDLGGVYLGFTCRPKY